MSNFANITSLIGMVFLFVVSCSGTQQEHSDNQIARVGDQYLSVNEAREDIPSYLLEQDSVYALQQFSEDWVRKQLLLREAERLDLAEKQEVQKKLREARQEVLVKALKDYVIGGRHADSEVSDEEARQFYQAQKEKFSLDEKFVKFRHMRTRSNGEARSARQDLLNGVAWPDVAQQYAVDPKSALQHSDQYWPISMAAKDIDIMNRYLNIIGQNEISPIQRVNGNYHFVQLIDRREEGEQPDLNWLMEQIKEWMVLNKNHRNFSSFLQNLYLEARSNNEVETFNVTSSQSNLNNSLSDSLEHNPTDE